VRQVEPAGRVEVESGDLRVLRRLALLAFSAAAGILGQSDREQMAEPVDRAARARALLSGGPTPTPADPGRPPPPAPIPSLTGSPEVLLGPAGTDLEALAGFALLPAGG
jgi:hypothetical protein